MKTVERVATNVRTIARNRGLTMKELSKRMGYRNEQILYTRLSGDSKMSVDELERAAEILDVAAEVLLSDPSELLSRMRGWSTADEMVAA
jgi:transcriptional regulator with XRE-family HTH domain